MGLFSSCQSESKENFIENFEKLINEANKGAKDYSNADWQKADEQFADYKDRQFPLWEDLMTPSEKGKVNEMIGKYQALQVKRAIKDVKNQVENVIDQTKTIYNELSEDSTLSK